MLKKIAFCFLLLISLSIAAAPSFDFSPTSLGLQYSYLLSGQTITSQKVNSCYRAHFTSLNYSPLPYLLFSAGIGINRFQIEQFNSTQFQGNWSISTLAGLSFFTPKLSQLLSATCGIDAYYLNSYYKNFVYSGGIYNPFAGIILSFSSFLDLETGVKGHLIDGLMKQSGSPAQPFSNNQKIRGYTELTLHSHQNGVYLRLSLDLSPEISIDWSDGPSEAALSLKLGIILRQDNLIKESSQKNEEHFPAFKDLKKRQDEMAEKLMNSQD